MFIMGASQYSALIFSVLTMLAALLSAIETFNCALGCLKPNQLFQPPCWFVLTLDARRAASSETVRTGQCAVEMTR